jgi:hypothetical protein
MANRPDALQSSRRSQCSIASVRTTWLYHPDAIQCLTKIRVSASRHNYGKTAATVRTMCDPVRTMSYIKQESAYQVQPSGRQPSWSGRSSFIYGNCVHQFNRPDISLQGPDAPKPYYGNYVQPKCNRPDARATPSGRSLVMEAFSTILERRLQLTVWTPFGILIITLYSNIRLGQNWHHWKADKKCFQLTIRTNTISIQTEPVQTERFALPDGPAENSRITLRTRKT